MECFEQSSAQVLWLPAKEDANRYECSLIFWIRWAQIRYHVASLHQVLPLELYRLGAPLFLEIICSFIRS
jgi:hypothetical protein